MIGNKHSIHLFVEGEIEPTEIDGDVHCFEIFVLGRRGRRTSVKVYPVEDGVTINSEDPIQVLPSASNAVTIKSKAL